MYLWHSFGGLAVLGDIQSQAIILLSRWLTWLWPFPPFREIQLWKWRVELWHPPVGDLQPRSLSVPWNDKPAGPGTGGKRWAKAWVCHVPVCQPWCSVFMGTRTAVPMACPPPDLGGKGHNAVGREHVIAVCYQTPWGCGSRRAGQSLASQPMSRRWHAATCICEHGQHNCELI